MFFSLGAQVKEGASDTLKVSHLHLKVAKDPKRAAMLSAVFPGFGQIYNRKFIKLPFVYGAIGGIAYGINWQNTRYQNFKYAYTDWVTKSPLKRYLDVVPEYYDVTTVDAAYFESQLQRYRDYYRRNRDLLIIAMGGVYVLNILDANIDAHLSNFDVSQDLSYNISPTILTTVGMPSVVGLRLEIKF